MAAGAFGAADSTPLAASPGQERAQHPLTLSYITPHPKAPLLLPLLSPRQIRPCRHPFSLSTSQPAVAIPPADSIDRFLMASQPFLLAPKHAVSHRTAPHRFRSTVAPELRSPLDLWHDEGQVG